MKIRVGDTVEVIAGKDKGKQGEVLQVLAKQDKVIVEGVNIVTKHIKPSQADPEGGIVTREAPIHVSNVAFYDSKTKAPVKLGYKIVEKDGKKIKVRVNKKTGLKLIKRKRSRRIKNEPFNGTLSKRSG
ncbi:50S ribosomal protein L24 [Thomasclavelia cocleata]|uniref:50S ribosomal protein L24 n=1 Tax=Thomasclavelia cocleata TaxID=69824 RepID=UPI000C272FE6|nr:50S ribosomal protein L24 [Thomasclavelia cocleata]PJN80135.1 50S ribosomal protein L24 [Thomasclavelia cocleata]